MGGLSKLILIGTVVKKPVYRETGFGGQAMFHVDVSLGDLPDRFLCVAYDSLAHSVMHDVRRGQVLCIEATMRSIRVRSVKRHVRVYYVSVQRYTVLESLPQRLTPEMFP